VAMAEIIRNLSNASVLVPEEGRELAADVFNREFRKIEAQWVKQPMQMTLASIPATPAASPSGVDYDEGNSGGEDDEEGENEEASPAKQAARLRMRKKARTIIKLRDQLEKATEDSWLELLRDRNLS